MRKLLSAIALLLAVHTVTTVGHAQEWLLGASMGLSSFDGSAGFHVTPMAEFRFNKSMGIGSELSVNTQYGVPLLWYPYFKYYFDLSGSGLKPYANAGPVMILNTWNAPSFGILFGGGINIPIGGGLSFAPDVLFGPVFGVGGGTYPWLLRGYYWGYETYGLTSYSIPSTTIFAFCIRGGIRYDL